MKRTLSILVVLTLIMSCFAVPVHAQSSDSNATLQTMDISTTPDGTIDVCFTVKNHGTTSLSRSDNLAETFTTTSVSFFPEDKAEQVEILERMNQARAGGTVYNDDWFFGESCYVYISVTYSSKTIGVKTYCRMDSVTARYSVNSGTTVKSEKIRMVCFSSSPAGESITEDKELNMTSTPFTTTYPQRWSYAYNGGLAMGSNITVTAQRPSGSTSTHTISANVFNN